MVYKAFPRGAKTRLGVGVQGGANGIKACEGDGRLGNGVLGSVALDLLAERGLVASIKGPLPPVSGYSRGRRAREPIAEST